MNNFLTVAGQVAVLFALMAVGAVLRKVKLLTDAAIDGMVNLLILVVTPCLIVDVFQRPFSSAMLEGLAIAGGIAIAGHLAVIVLAKLCVRHRDENVQRPMLLAAVFSNAGFMGIPLEHAILGDNGVFYGVVYVAVFNLFIWSWGYRTMNQQSLSAATSMSRSKMLINPGTIGIACGLPLFFLSVKLPAIIGEPVKHIAALNTPVAMIIIGYCLFGAKLGKVAKMPVVYVATGIRLVAYPLLVIAAMFPFRPWLDRDMMLAITIAASAPVAAMVSMFATKFGRDVDTSVAVVSASTLLSIATMPLIIALAMGLF